jgi:MoCo/4Fe-4S cofactor protein with predicted Tat translocation signal
MSAPLDLETVRKKLDGASGPRFWRSLEELSRSPGFDELLEAEFPGQTPAEPDGIDRRRFLELMAASLALAGLTGCSQAPPERILPYVRPPEGITAGRPAYFATAMPTLGYAQGLLVESRLGRPTKIEGNPTHPANLAHPDAHGPHGPTDIYAQASILSLYDPDRSQNLTYRGEISSREDFIQALRSTWSQRGEQNLRLRIVTETVTSPTLAHQIQTILQRFPQARWHIHEPLDTGHARQGAIHAFGEPLDMRLRLERADVIVSLDCDFLSAGPTAVRFGRDFSMRRGKRTTQGASPTMNRLYVAESNLTVTGMSADHRWAMKSSAIESLAYAIARGLNISAGDAPRGPAHGIAESWVAALVTDLQAHRGRCVVLVGESQPPYVHALGHAINSTLGAFGNTVEFTAPVCFRPPADQDASLRGLFEAIDRNEVDALLIVGGNPAYNAPADLDFANKLMRVPFRAHLSNYADETSNHSLWHIPSTHYLESWGDVRAFDGTISIIQPLIAPLYGGMSPYEFLGLLTQEPSRSTYDVVRGFWRQMYQPADRDDASMTALRRSLGMTQPRRGDFEAWWRKAVHDGFVERSALPARNASIQANWTRAPRTEAAADGVEIVLQPDPTQLDGRWANNGWLQELPKPVTKLTWEAGIHVSPTTAVRRGYASENRPEEADGRHVEIDIDGRKIVGPLVVVPGHADDTFTVHLGYGRTSAGRIGTNLGYSGFAIRTSEHPWRRTGVAAPRLVGTKLPLARTQNHFLMENRDLVFAGTQDHPPAIPQSARMPRRSLTLYSDHPGADPNQQWAMVIDLSRCTGCSSCVVACQSENNIQIVGKEQVLRSREMHWIRIDTYFKQEQPNWPLEVYRQPLPCMHCENAPCEVVCPVEATVHSNDGLNDMVYNRCVGTRYCSNNCPYKVRRFNFLQYADFETPVLQLGRNPEVTVRSRGVMEKCTYCVQRIRRAEIEATVHDRPRVDGDVVTACQSVCPSGAITFGNLMDRNSRVSKLNREPTHYGLLADLNTRPRTTYLAALKNPNPRLAELERQR